MDTLRFEWDPAKSRANLRKHGIRFETAQLAFLDEHGLLIADPDHSWNEERFVLLGKAGRTLLVVVHCYRQSGNVIRIISARLATARESAQYEGDRP